MRRSWVFLMGMAVTLSVIQAASGISWASSFSSGTAAMAAPVLAAVAFAQQDPPKLPDVDVNVTKETKTTTWYADPVIVGVGVVALLVVIVIVALVARGGGGATVIRQ